MPCAPLRGHRCADIRRLPAAGALAVGSNLLTVWLDHLLVGVVALIASALTLFSGFGLWTLLLPDFLVFFPSDEAVAMTAPVHFVGNLFKLFLAGRNADLGVVPRFGLSAIPASVAGAALLLTASGFAPVATYSVAGRIVEILPEKLVMGLLVGGFALVELMPSMHSRSVGRGYIPPGGFLSGFFGGLSGHQGALRSTFLLRAGLGPEAFVGTGVVLACLVGLTPLGVYARHTSRRQASRPTLGSS